MLQFKLSEKMGIQVAVNFKAQIFWLQFRYAETDKSLLRAVCEIQKGFSASF